MNDIHLHLGMTGDGPVSCKCTTSPGSYVGHLTVGPARFIEWLELHVGLSGTFPTFNERAITLKSLLTSKKVTAAFFSRSFQSDPLGVSKRLLTLWDSWIMGGWNMQLSKKLPSRMAALAQLRELFVLCGPGLAERTTDLVNYSYKRLPSFLIHLVDPPDSFPYIFQQLLLKFQDRIQPEYKGMKPQGKMHSDLWKLQQAVDGVKVPEPVVNDGTLQLIQFENDIAEANAIYSLQYAASWSPVIINHDNSLLNGIHITQNYPVSNWQTIAGNGQVSQLFFLATALFRRPVNTSQVIAFLLAPLSPLPRTLATALAQVFSQRPGFGNEAWNTEIEQYEKSIVGQENERSQAKRISFWLQNQQFLEEPGLTVSFLQDIFRELGQWASQHAHLSSQSLYIGQLSNLAGLCDALVAILQTEGESISVSKFERLQAELFADVSSTIAEAELGSADYFSTPGAIWSPCREIVWMGATRFEPKNHLTTYWYQEEKDYFAKLGLPLQDESWATAAYNTGLRRMVMSATERLVITLPTVVGGARAAKPYCLDEWRKLISLSAITLEAGTLLDRVPWKRDVLLTSEHERIALPKAPAYFSIPRENFRREKESYSSIEKLLQHPAEWYMDYRLKLRHIDGITVPNANIIKGVIADRVVQVLFNESNKKEKWWKSDKIFSVKADEVVNRVLIEEGLPFLEKKTKRLLLEYKTTLAHSLNNLRNFIQANRLVIVSTQYTVKGTIDGTPFEGYVDLLLKCADRNVVIDLKWANSSGTYRNKLKAGNDLQLVLYAQILDKDSSAGYFMLNDGGVYMRNEKLNEGYSDAKYEEGEEGVNTLAIYERAVKGLQYRRKELAEGKAEAGYEESIQELAYFRDTPAMNLYPLKERNQVKQSPYSDDFYLFFGKII